jgi:hypothetical protein
MNDHYRPLLMTALERQSLLQFLAEAGVEVQGAASTPTKPAPHSIITPNSAKRTPRSHEPSKSD